MKKVKQLVKLGIQTFIKKTSKNKYFSYCYEQLIEQIRNQTQTVNHKETLFHFSVPNHVNHFRADTFSTKEPETLEWIDSFEEGSIFWDIGANVGLYSIYAAKTKNCEVIAFEPSFFNLEFLARNLKLNQVTDQVTVFPIALNNTLGINIFNFSNLDWGGALSSFGCDTDHDGKPMKPVFSYKTIGVSADNIHKNFNTPLPDYLKMDVDGIEHLIFSGSKNILKHVKSLSVEINDGYIEQANQSSDLLKKSGLEMQCKRHSEMLENSNFQSIYNQIWIRK